MQKKIQIPKAQQAKAKCGAARKRGENIEKDLPKPPETTGNHENVTF